MEVLSLFDGMSGGQIALTELGHKFKYYASEVDKFAIAQTQLNFPETIQLGDIENWHTWIIEAKKQRKKTGTNNFRAKEFELRTDGKTGTLQTNLTKDNIIIQLYQSNESGGRNNILDGYKLRRLTPLECARLQTIPEWYKWECSDTQAYKMLGNGWTIDIIKHILSFI